MNGCMSKSILLMAAAMPDRELLARIEALAGTERETTAELVAHLAALEMRPSLYASLGYGSLFDYCTQVLRLSEDAACNRTRAARTCREFPIVLELLSSGAITLTAIRLLQPHLTAENHRAVLGRATHKRCKEVEALVAELAPKPDVPSTVRKLPGQRASDEPPDPALTFSGDEATHNPIAPAPSLDRDPAGSEGTHPSSEDADVLPGRWGTMAASPKLSETMVHQGVPAASRPVVRASAPGRYRVQFTIGQDTHDKLRRLQALMRREIPSGDLALIFDQAIGLMLEKVEKAKFGAKTRDRPRPGDRRGGGAYENRIRFKTDDRARARAPVASTDETSHASSEQTTRANSVDGARGNSVDGGSAGPPILRPKPSRHVPSQVKRAVWWRDRAQCAFVSAAGHRCTERAFLEIHHIHPFALDGPSTAGNLSLRCRRHNAYEAEIVFGARRVGPGTAS